MNHKYFYSDAYGHHFGNSATCWDWLRFFQQGMVNKQKDIYFSSTNYMVRSLQNPVIDL